MKIKIVKIGWEEENNLVPLVLLDARTREELGVEFAGLVQVKNEDKFMLAGVQLQFKNLIGQGATINSYLSLLLSVKEGDEIEITKLGQFERNLPERNLPYGRDM